MDKICRRRDGNRFWVHGARVAAELTNGLNRIWALKKEHGSPSGAWET
jgi:hypothetical protein